MKTIKGTINYCFFCFTEIHSFNFNFTLTVLMYNFAAKNFIFPSGSLKLICISSSTKQQKVYKCILRTMFSIKRVVSHNTVLERSKWKENMSSFLAEVQLLEKQLICFGCSNIGELESVTQDK